MMTLLSGHYIHRCSV